jgi:addiction module HigA family antidote
MNPTSRVSVHPGEVLMEEFLQPLGISQAAFARHIGMGTNRVNEIVRGKRSVTAETAWLFAMATGTTPEFWLNLQDRHDLSLTRPQRRILRIGAAS